MPYRNQALPSAKEEKRWLCDTYGVGFGDSLESWIDSLVRCGAAVSDEITVCPLQDVIRNAQSPAQFVRRRLGRSSSREILKAFLTFIRNRRPPWESLVARKRIFNDGYYVCIDAYFEVDHSNKRMVFTKLDHYGDRQEH